MARVFLGGTCNESKWRNMMMVFLHEKGLEYFNPVVDDWTPDCMVEELRQREQCDYVLYVITPEMTGVYSIAEVVDDSNKQPEKTVFCIMSEYGHKTFSDGQLKSLMSVGRMVERNGGKYIINDFNAVSYYLNRG